MSLGDLRKLEQERLQELLATTVSLLESDLSRFMDSDTHAQLSRMRDVVELWLQGKSRLAHEQMMTEVAELTKKLSTVNPAMLLADNLTRH